MGLAGSRRVMGPGDAVEPVAEQGALGEVVYPCLQDPIVITGATGALNGATVEHLIKRVPAAPRPADRDPSPDVLRPRAFPLPPSDPVEREAVHRDYRARAEHADAAARSHLYGHVEFVAGLGVAAMHEEITAAQFGSVDHQRPGWPQVGAA